MSAGKRLLIVAAGDPIEQENWGGQAESQYGAPWAASVVTRTRLLTAAVRDPESDPSAFGRAQNPINRPANTRNVMRPEHLLWIRYALNLMRVFLSIDSGFLRQELFRFLVLSVIGR